MDTEVAYLSVLLGPSTVSITAARTIFSGPSPSPPHTHSNPNELCTQTDDVGKGLQFIHVSLPEKQEEGILLSIPYYSAFQHSDSWVS